MGFAEDEEVRALGEAIAGAELVVGDACASGVTPKGVLGAAGGVRAVEMIGEEAEAGLVLGKPELAEVLAGDAAVSEGDGEEENCDPGEASAPAGGFDSEEDGCGDDTAPAAEGGDSEAVPGDPAACELEPGVADPPEAAEGVAGVPEDAGALPPDVVGVVEDVGDVAIPEGDPGEATNLAAAADAAAADAEAASADPAATQLCLSAYVSLKFLSRQQVKFVTL